MAPNKIIYDMHILILNNTPIGMHQLLTSCLLPIYVTLPEIDLRQGKDNTDGQPHETKCCQLLTATCNARTATSLNS
jgi:hypothetical protein